MILESISIKPVGGQGQMSRPFMGLIKLEKAYNVVRALFFDYNFSQNHPGENVNVKASSFKIWHHFFTHD